MLTWVFRLQSNSLWRRNTEKITRGKVKEELIDVYLMKLSRNAFGIRLLLQFYLSSTISTLQNVVNACVLRYFINWIWSHSIKTFEYFVKDKRNSLTNRHVFKCYFELSKWNVSMISSIYWNYFMIKHVKCA